MPAPPLAYTELQAAMEWGYTMRAWQEESTVNRAKATAHVIHRNLRQGFDQEAAMADLENKGKGQNQVGYEDYMRGMLGLK